MTAELRDGIKLLMFDQYGTVVDMQGGLIEVATPYLKGKGWSGRPDAFVTWWRRTHFENSMIDALLHREHIPYRRIGEISVDTTLERAGIPHTDADVSWLVAQIEKLRPFPDVPAAMALLTSPEYLIPPSAMSGTPASRQAFEQAEMAVIWGTPAPETTRVVQMEPGPMPTLMPSTPSEISSLAPS